jgi:putative ABC transport system permease protein
MSEMFGDLRLAARRLARAPGFTAAVLVTLSLGMGANTAIFSFVQGVLLRPLPFPEPDRLVMVCETNPEQMGSWCAASPANAADWGRMSRTLESVGLARSWPFGVKTDRKIPGVRGGIATPGLFRALRVDAAAGRLLLPRDMERGNEHVAVVSHSFWKAHLGGAADAVGHTVEIDGVQYEVVGVLPEGFQVPYLESTDLWIPLWPERQERREWRGFIPFARLAEGVSLAQAQSEMDLLRAGLAKEHPETNRAWGVSVESLRERITRPVRPMLLAFLAAAGLVLLIACANVANLMLARSLAREREQAVRLALGASLRRLARGVLSESLLLSLAGGVAGGLIALWAVDLFVGLAPEWFPRLEGVRVNLPVLGFSLLLSLITAFACALAPVLSTGRMDLQDILRSGRATGQRRRGGRIREALVITEIALALILLAGAGLLIHSFTNLLRWKPGFDTENLVGVQIFSSPGKVRQAQLADLFRRAREEVRSVPSVVSAGAGSAVPLFGGDGEEEFEIVDRTAPAAGSRPSAAWIDVDPEYFRTLRLPVVAGRDFTPEDKAGAPLVAIVNETMARRFWPDSKAIGARVRMQAHEATLQVVGVVRDVQPFHPGEKPAPQIFWPFAQFPRWAVEIVARTSEDPLRAAGAIRKRLQEVDPEMELGRFHTMDDLVGRELTNPRFSMTLAALFSLIALATAAVGIYGLMAFAVAQRTREIGIRMAIGARRGEILRLVLRKGLLLAAAGLGAGLAGALGLTRTLKSLLVEVAPSDPAAFAAAALVLLLAALAACCLPALRAASVDPMVVLRDE